MSPAQRRVNHSCHVSGGEYEGHGESSARLYHLTCKDAGTAVDEAILLLRMLKQKELKE